MVFPSRISFMIRRVLSSISQLRGFSSSSPRRSPVSTFSITQSDRLLTRLGTEPDYAVKFVLDSEESSVLKMDNLFWESLIIPLRYSSSSKARLVLEWKLEKLLEKNYKDLIHYTMLIDLCGKTGNLDFAFEVFILMEGHGIKPDTTVFNSLVSACLSARNTVTSISLFEIMERTVDCKPDLATFNLFISAYSKYGDEDSMKAWYTAAKAAGFALNVGTYEPLITGSVRTEKNEDVMRFYKEMLQSDINPSTPILESVLTALCRQKNFTEIKEFVKFVLDGGRNLTEKMVEQLQKLYSEHGMVEEMEVLLASMKSDQTCRVLYRLHLGIVRIYALSDRLDDLEYSVGRMLKNGMNFELPQDVEAIICSYFRQEAYERLDMFLDRIRNIYRLPRSCYDLLLAGYKRAGLSGKLDLIMKEMKDAVLPNPRD